jgi:hypothetical protein
MKRIDKYAKEPLDAKSDGLHINPLEFIMAFVNLWIVVKLVQSLPSLSTGYIIDLLSANTSALSWMWVTAQSCDPMFQPLACVASTLLVVASQHLTHVPHVQPIHIPGMINHKADYLSCSKNGCIPSWECIIEQCSQLKNCMIFLLPCELLSSLVGLISSGLLEDTYVPLTTHLLTLDFGTLPWLGVKGYDKQYACTIPKSLGLDLIGAYLGWVLQGNYLPSSSKGPIGKQTFVKAKVDMDRYDFALQVCLMQGGDQNELML